jgi:prepilin-type N-terminal cleavage/methylation domain-containing protein
MKSEYFAKQHPVSNRGASVNLLSRRRTRLIGPRHNAGQIFALTRGFTLIELLGVVAIALVVMGMALPIVQSSNSKFQVRAAVSSVAGVIQQTRYQAIAQGYPFQVVFNHSAGTYQITSSPTNNGVFTNVGGAVPFSSSTTLGADATLQFSGGGSVKATAGTMILVLTRSGKTGTITVSNYGNVNTVYGP